MWIFRYLRADLEEIDVGPYDTQEEAQKARDRMASFDAICLPAIKVEDDYKMLQEDKVELEYWLTAGYNLDMKHSQTITASENAIIDSEEIRASQIAYLKEVERAMVSNCIIVVDAPLPSNVVYISNVFNGWPQFLGSWPSRFEYNYIKIQRHCFMGTNTIKLQ